MIENWHVYVTWVFLGFIVLELWSLGGRLAFLRETLESLHHKDGVYSLAKLMENVERIEEYARDSSWATDRIADTVAPLKSHRPPL